MTKAMSEYVPTEEDIKHVREWIAKMPHLANEKDDDNIRALITVCKGSLQRTKSAFEKFNGIGYTFPHLFGHLDPLNETTQYYLNNAYLFPMPKKTDDGCIILIGASRKNEIDPSKFSVFEINRYLLMTYLVLLKEDNLGEAKFIFVFDCQNVKMSELRNVTLTYLRDFLMTAKHFPIRFKGSHNINVPAFFRPIMNFMKENVYKKLAERIHFHNSMEELQENISKEFLPKEFGGDDEDLDTLHNAWKRKVESHRDRLISVNNEMRKLDRLRPKSNTERELQGSFRKLQID